MDGHCCTHLKEKQQSAVPQSCIQKWAFLCTMHEDEGRKDVIDVL
jgi:hypothetical protein